VHGSLCSFSGQETVETVGHTWMQKGEEATISIKSGPTFHCCPYTKIGTGGRAMPEHEQ
jgi:hypothetical protein